VSNFLFLLGIVSLVVSFREVLVGTRLSKSICVTYHLERLWVGIKNLYSVFGALLAHIVVLFSVFEGP